MTTVQTRSILTSWSALLMTTLLAATSLSAQATLTAYSANGTNLVRMQSGSVDLSFTADGNLLGTLLSQHASDPTAFINEVIAATPGGTISDPFFGTRTLSAASDFDASGRVSWFAAQAVINYVNSVNYAGTNQWRLPTFNDLGATGCTSSYSGTDCGYNVNVASGDLAALYYTELGKTARYRTSGTQRTIGFGIFGNAGAQVAGGVVGSFTNVMSETYWYGTQDPLNTGAAVAFGSWNGQQTVAGKENLFYLWAVTPGQVTPVPVPASALLLAPALLGLARRRRSRAADGVH